MIYVVSLLVVIVDMSSVNHVYVNGLHHHPSHVQHVVNRLLHNQ